MTSQGHLLAPQPTSTAQPTSPGSVCLCCDMRWAPWWRFLQWSTRDPRALPANSILGSGGRGGRRKIMEDKGEALALSCFFPPLFLYLELVYMVVLLCLHRCHGKQSRPCRILISRGKVGITGYLCYLEAFPLAQDTTSCHLILILLTPNQTGAFW